MQCFCCVFCLQEHTLLANVEVITTTKEGKPWTRPPIQMSFQVRWQLADWQPDVQYPKTLNTSTLGHQMRRRCRLGAHGRRQRAICCRNL